MYSIGSHNVMYWVPCNVMQPRVRVSLMCVCVVCTVCVCVLYACTEYLLLFSVPSQNQGANPNIKEHTQEMYSYLYRCVVCVCVCVCVFVCGRFAVWYNLQALILYYVCTD